MKSSPTPLRETLWQRFREDDRSTLNGRWGMVVLALWIAAQGLWSLV